MKLKHGSPDNRVDLDMTPMIDIVFQLITFFMVVINFEAGEIDERVKLAQSELARPPKVKPDNELVLQMGFQRDKEGQVTSGSLLFYNSQAIPLEEFRPLLKRETAFYRLSNPTGPIRTTVVIRADAESPAGQVQELIRLCQEEKYEKFSLRAMQPEAR
jgi:biopolymer transport protein ExbD